MSQDEENKGHRLIRATHSIQMLGISKGQDTQRWRAGTGSLGTGSGPGWTGSDPHGPQILPLGLHDLVRTPGPWWLGSKGGNEWVPGSFSRPREVLLSCPLVLSDTTCFYSCHDNVEHTALVAAGSVLCFPTEVLRKYTRRGATKRGRVLVFAEQGWPTGKRSHSNLTCCPLVFCLIPVPGSQLTRWTCLPTETECAENWITR